MRWLGGIVGSVALGLAACHATDPSFADASEFIGSANPSHPPQGRDGGADAGLDGGTDGGLDAGVLYATDVQPIWDARCAPCHITDLPRAGQLDLAGPAEASRARLVNVASRCNFGVLLVAPGDAGASMLWRKLAYAPGICGAPEPPGTTGLIDTSPADFEKIERWIVEGARDN